MHLFFGIHLSKRKRFVHMLVFQRCRMQVCFSHRLSHSCVQQDQLRCMPNNYDKSNESLKSVTSMHLQKFNRFQCAVLHLAFRSQTVRQLLRAVQQVLRVSSPLHQTGLSVPRGELPNQQQCRRCSVLAHLRRL